MALKPKILYFINTSQPTNYDRQVASRIGASVSFRNIKNVIGTTVEPCDGVTGVVIPAPYQGKPTAQQAMTAYNAAQSASVTAARDMAKAKQQEAALSARIAADTTVVAGSTEA